MLRSYPFLLAVLTALVAFGSSSLAVAQEAPLQATLVVVVAGDPAAAVTSLEGGNARVRIRVSNVDETTARVVMTFRYRIPPDTIALDEIVDRIRIETETLAGDPVGEASIDPNDINLNPNSRSLRYQVSMNRPEGSYRARVRVNGNYE